MPYLLAMVSSCAVPRCYDRLAKRHRFPNPDKDFKRFKTWLDILANPRLRIEDAKRIYKNRLVCHLHFRPGDFRENQWLSKTAVPSMYLCK